jgi:hypothetical protein
MVIDMPFEIYRRGDGLVAVGYNRHKSLNY